MSVFLAGFAVSCGALLILAGLGKVYRGVRRMDGATAIWRALRFPRRLVARAELALGGVECLTGAAVAAQVCPVAAGVAMSGLGAAFCVMLLYVRAKRVPGGCGCLGWRKRAEAAAATVTWRAVLRAGTLVAAGTAAASGVTATGRPASFYAGTLTGGVVLGLLSTRAPLRTPRCRRPLWRPAHVSVRALTGHEVFAAMAGAAGPFGAEIGHRRAGCADEFWFPAAGGDGGNAVVFRVSYAAPGDSLTVHASLVRAM
jgi:methylamine utilization protein MauE